MNQVEYERGMESIFRERAKVNREMARMLDIAFAKCTDAEMAAVELALVLYFKVRAPDSPELQSWVGECFAEARAVKAARGRAAS